jgi:integrase
VAALLKTLNADLQPRGRTNWTERDRALILTALLVGLRADELLRAKVGDPPTTAPSFTFAARAAKDPPGPDRTGAGRSPRARTGNCSSG